MSDLLELSSPKLNSAKSNGRRSNRTPALAMRTPLPLLSSLVLFTTLLINSSAGANSPENKFGKASVEPVRIAGKVLLSSGLPAADAKIKVVGHRESELDATVEADANGCFDFAIRYPRNLIHQLEFVAESSDGKEIALERFAGNEKEPVTEGVEIKLRTTRAVDVEVLDANGRPVEDSQVALQIGFPSCIAGRLTDLNGRVQINLPKDERIVGCVAWKDGEGLDYRLYTLSREQQADVKAVAPEFPSDRPERLVLAGVKPLKVKLIDGDGEPIAGAKISPWLLQNDSQPDSLNFSYFKGIFSQQTDAAGETTFQWMPAWQKQVVTFWPSLEGYESPRGNFNPENGNGEFTITMERLVPIRGQVTDPTGKPSGGIKVVAQGVGRSFNRFSQSVDTDEEGRYELLLAPNQIYILTAGLGDEWVAAPHTGFAALPNKPLEESNFQLRKPTRVHGQLRNERTEEPIANERVIVYQFGTGLHEMPEVELPNPENERYVLQPIVQYSANTNAEGEFEFLLGDGKFDIRPPQQEKAEKFEIAGDAEIKLNVTTNVQKEVELVGLVVSKSDQKPIAKAKITGVPRSFRGGDWDWQAETDIDGKFKVKRREEPTYVRAVNADGSLASVQELADTNRVFVMQLQPVGSARGRLVGDDGKPLVARQIDYGIDVPGIDRGIFSTRFGGKAVTDAQGEFEMKSLAAGWKYQLRFPANADGVYQNLSDATVMPGQTLDLGDLTEPEPYKPFVPPTLETRIRDSFDVKGTAIERHAKALELIKLVKQHLLVVFGLPDDPKIRSLMEIRFNDPEFRPFTDEFRFMAIPTDEQRLPAALTLASQLEEDLPESKQAFQLVILDCDGKKVASAGVEQLCNDSELSKDKLFELFRKHLTEPLDARLLLADALERAGREDKRVIVQETATWCGPCHMLARLLDKNRVWEKDYVWVKIDQRWTGAEELMAELREGAEGGIPWFAILDADGKKLATSNTLSGSNIGFPSEAEGKTHFTKMLNETRKKMTDEDVQSLIEAIERVQ